MAKILENRYPRIVTTDSQNNSSISGGSNLVRVDTVGDGNAIILQIKAKELYELLQNGTVVYFITTFSEDSHDVIVLRFITETAKDTNTDKYEFRTNDEYYFPEVNADEYPGKGGK